MVKKAEITIATVNTFFGKTLRAEDGFRAVKDIDILLLQETYLEKPDSARKSLALAGFDMVAHNPLLGFSIAKRNASRVRLVSNSVRDVVLQHDSRFGVWMTRHYSRRPFTEIPKGLIAATFETGFRQRIMVVSTHAPVVTSPRRRVGFLQELAVELTNSCYSGNLVLAGDKNHYPRARKPDVVFQKSTGLTAVELGGAYTWPSKHTGYLESKLGRLYGGQLDDMLYRGSLQNIGANVVDVVSDHRAIVGRFVL